MKLEDTGKNWRTVFFFLCFWKFSIQFCASLGPEVQDLPRSRETVSLHGCQIVRTYRAYINYMENQMKIMESWKKQHKNTMKHHQGTSFQSVLMDFKDDFGNGDAGRRSNLEEISSQLISTAVRLLRRCVHNVYSELSDRVQRWSIGPWGDPLVFPVNNV